MGGNWFNISFHFCFYIIDVYQNIKDKILKETIAKIAPEGNVITHEEKIFRITARLIAAIPLARPTPIIAPTSVCVVEIGSPVAEAKTTVIAVAN